MPIKKCSSYSGIKNHTFNTQDRGSYKDVISFWCTSISQNRIENSLTSVNLIKNRCICCIGLDGGPWQSLGQLLLDLICSIHPKPRLLLHSVEYKAHYGKFEELKPARTDCPSVGTCSRCFSEEKAKNCSLRSFWNVIELRGLDTGVVDTS